MSSRRARCCARSSSPSASASRGRRSARRCGVSRRSGSSRSSRTRGVRVRTLSHDDLREAFLVRAELEALVTEIAARKMTPEALAELEECEKRFARLTKEIRSHEPGGEPALADGGLDAREPCVPRRALPGGGACRTSSRWRRARAARSPGRPSGRRSTRSSSASTSGTRPSTARSGRRSRRGSVAGARVLAHEHVMHSFRAADHDPRPRRRRLGAQLSFTTRPELRGTFGAVASTHWLATQTGMAVLERGGNAFDAVCAAGFVLQVVEPHLNGPGGDLPAVFWPAESGKPLVLCAQGVAPAAATIERFRVARARARAGHRVEAACVPGSFGGWLLLLEQFGTWPLDDVLAYAIGYAEHGYPVVAGITATIARPSRCCASGPGRPSSTCRLREPGLDVPQPAARRDLAAPARRVRRDGRRRSPRLLRGLRRRRDRPLLAREHGGLLTGDDLASLAGDARAAGDGRLPRAHGLQDGSVGAGPRGAAAAAPARRLRPLGRSARRSSCTS